MIRRLAACALAACLPMTALGQDARPAPGETRAAVVNGRLHHTPKRFETPACLAKADAARQAKATARQQARAAREHRLAVKDGRVNHVPKAPTSMMAAGDQ